MRRAFNSVCMDILTVFYISKLTGLSVYETCACVIHTILLCYMCINIVSHFTLMFARGTCAS